MLPAGGCTQNAHEELSDFRIDCGTRLYAAAVPAMFVGGGIEMGCDGSLDEAIRTTRELIARHGDPCGR